MWTGVCVGITIGEIADIENDLIIAAIAIGLGLICGYIGTKLKRLVSCVGTAIVGAFFVTHGIGFYGPKFMGKYDKHDAFKPGPNYYILFGGLALLGSLI